MDLLAAFEPADRAHLLDASDAVALQPGQYLLRRGEAGGDVYLVEAGRLDVVDSRRSPEVILSALGPGAVVGDMAFVDGSPRSADVRASVASTVRRWTREDLTGLVGRYPTLGLVLYRTIASMAADRLRGLNEGAATAAFSLRANQADLSRAESEARELADRVKTSLLDQETLARGGNRTQLEEVTRRVRATLDGLQNDVAKLFASFVDPAAASAASAVLARELRPFLTRSTLADRCLRRPTGVAAGAEILSHIHVNTASGEGWFGEIVDRWLLDRPTFAGLRAIRTPTVGLLQKVLPPDGHVNVLVLNAGAGTLVASLAHALAGREATLCVMDQSRESLAFLDVDDANPMLQVVALTEQFPAFATGRGRQRLLGQDVAIVDGLIEYLPERVTFSLIGVLRSVLRPGGTLVLTTLAQTPDRELVDRVLNWPTLRRNRAALQGLLAGGGLTVSAVYDPGGAALLAAGRTPT
jgi:CRP-like cAMP-binding protein